VVARSSTLTLCVEIHVLVSGVTLVTEPATSEHNMELKPLTVSNQRQPRNLDFAVVCDSHHESFTACWLRGGNVP